jgi:hypothetical protein
MAGDRARVCRPGAEGAPPDNGSGAAGREETTWGDGPTDGLGATIGPWWCNSEAARLGVPMAELDLMREIAAYNEVDVRSMAEVVTWLGENR